MVIWSFVVVIVNFECVGGHMHFAPEAGALGLSAKAAINAWKALIRPVLEYGAEVIQYSKNASGSWPEADQIQMQMGRRILGCHPRTANAAVKGDLGWQSLKARRDMLRLRYWGKLVSMNSKRWYL